MKHIFENAEQMLKETAVPAEFKAVLEKVLDKICGTEEGLSGATHLYQTLYLRKEPLQKEIVMDDETEEVAHLYSAVIFARICYLQAERVFDDRLDLLAPFVRFHEVNLKRYGHYGIIGTNRNWCYLYAFPRLFTLGRLSFEMANFSYASEAYEKDGERIVCPIHNGEEVLSVHMPGKEKLSEEAVDLAFEMAEDFFKRYYPEYRPRAYVCSSWLLNPELARFLPEDSNIMKFQKRFTLSRGPVNDFSLFHNIFDKPNPCPLEELKPANRFQREILQYVKDGGLLYSGRGFILIREEEK